MADLADDLALAEEAARTAGEVLLSYFRGPLEEVESKSTATDLVTEADRDAERLIVELLQVERPDDGLLGEEGSERPGASGRRWVVDPLDGTVNFFYGHPQWCVSVGLEDSEGVLVGVVLDPVRGEAFRATRGGGAFVGATPIRMREEVGLEQAMIATGFAYSAELRAQQAELLRRALPRVRDIRRGGAAALDLAWLAAGRFDGYYERGLNPWDWAAGSLLVREAGGAVARPEGEPAGLAAARPELLGALVGLLNSGQ